MTIKVLTFSCASGLSEMACIESSAQDGFQIKDAIRRLVNDDELIQEEAPVIIGTHSYVRFISDNWIVTVTM